ncbi:MAG TPA: TetR/AcrR family transcriptional regulator [Solirubrobacterales bacterium]
MYREGMAVTPKAESSPDVPVPKGRGRRGARPSGDDRERAILETAERLLDERPLSEISVDDLARGAGISRPTFYFYFPSKDAVVLTIVERLVADAGGSREEITTALAEEGPRAGLRVGLENLYAAFRARPGVVRAGTDLRTTNQEARDVWAGVMERWVADVTAVIEFERARGVAPPGQPARDLAIALVQMNERAQYATLLGEQPSIEADRVLDVLIDVWLRAIYGTAEPG